MNDASVTAIMTGHNASGNPSGRECMHDLPALPCRWRSAARACALLIVTAVLAGLPAYSLAASASRVAVQDNPRLAKLQVDVWPEFDRPQALVMLHGELAPDAKLPAAITLRIPASSKEPTAVAFANTADGDLLNLEHETKAGADFTIIRFTVPQRYFHVEFYDAIGNGTRERRYIYTWPGDFEAAAATLRVQEPAQAADVSVKPALGTTGPGPKNLIYRQGEIGPLKAGKAVPIEIRYTKQDARTSSEILGRNPTPPAQAAAAKGLLGDLPMWLVALSVALIVSTVAGTIIVWSQRQSKGPASSRTGARFCSKCGTGLDDGDHFCSKCGTAVRKK